MLAVIYFLILLSSGFLQCSQIPFIQDVTLVPRCSWNGTTVINQSYQQCLCTSLPSFVAFNWFPNKTCQMFYTFPITYAIQSMSQARLYFPQRIFPDASQSYMSNTSELLSRLSTANTISANVSTPRCLAVDNHGYLVTVSLSLDTIVRLYPNNLTMVNQPIPPIFTSSPKSIMYYNEAYYVGFSSSVLILSSNNLTILQNISTLHLNQTRDMMMLNNGQVLLVVSTSTSSLLFFNASNHYNLFYRQSVNYKNPHGLRYVNDSFFYVTSWSGNTIYSYSANQNSLVWTETLFLNATPIAPSTDGNHLVIDNCNRYWFILGANGIKIFDNQGLFLANVPQLATYNFDVVITDDYVIYISSTASNQIIRVDPNIQC